MVEVCHLKYGYGLYYTAVIWREYVQIFGLFQKLTQHSYYKKNSLLIGTINPHDFFSNVSCVQMNLNPQSLLKAFGKENVLQEVHGILPTGWKSFVVFLCAASFTSFMYIHSFVLDSIPWDDSLLQKENMKERAHRHTHLHILFLWTIVFCRKRTWKNVHIGTHTCKFCRN